MCSQSWVGLFGNTDFEWPANMHELISVWLHLPAHCVRQAEHVASWCLEDQTKDAIPRQHVLLASCRMLLSLHPLFLLN